MEFHEIANVYPLMSRDAVTELAEDIKKNGLLMPIVVYEDKILDGRNRWAACVHAQVEPHFTPFNGKIDPLDFVISANDKRRHLTPGQRAAAAAKAANMKGGGEYKKKNQASSKEGACKPQPLVSQQEAAKKFDVSRAQVERAVEVMKADPETFEKLREGKVTVGAALKKAREPKKAPEKPGLDPSKNIPGQIILEDRPRSSPSRDERILAAINSGKGLVPAAKEAAEAERLGFDGQHLKALIDQLKAEISSRNQMKRALEAHLKKG